MAKEETPAVEMAMSPDEFAELRAQAAAAGQNDFHLGRVLDLIVLHLGHAHGLDAATEDAKAAALAEEAEKAKLEAEAADTAKAEDETAKVAAVAPAQGEDNVS